MDEIANPFSTRYVTLGPTEKVTPLETNCALKAAMVTVGGGAMGFAMALFMNAVEFREIEYGRSKMPTRAVLRVPNSRNFRKISTGCLV
jgi:import inner membrane translocase subunit TIM22